MEVSKESAWRLWASRQAADMKDRANGFQAGREWAADTAEAHELQRLSRWWDETNGVERDYTFDAKVNNVLSVDQRIEDVIAGGITGDFWDVAYGKTPDERPEWFRGFAEGAVEFWRAAEPLLTPMPEAATA